MKKCKSLFAILLALSLLLSLPMAVSAAEADLPYVPLMADATPAANVTVDGVIEEAWGAPVASWTAAELKQVDGDNPQWNIWAQSPTTDQHIELYVRRNSERMMVAVRLVNANGLDKPTSTSGWEYAKCRIVFGQYYYKGGTNIESFSYKGNNFERFAGWTVTQTWSEETQSFTKHCTKSIAPGQTVHSLSDSNYAIGWDEQTRSYTYEFSLTYDELYNYVSPNNDLMLGVEVFDCHMKDEAEYGNRWFLSDAAHENLEVHYDANMTGMTAGKPMRIVFADDSYINTTANAMPATAPVLDGTVTEAEWGKPTMVVSSEYNSYTGKDSYMFFGQKAALDPDKRAKVWITNDAQYIYLAGTLDHEELYPESTKNWYPEMIFAVGAQGATTDLDQFPLGDKVYERFTKFAITFDKAGTTATTKQSTAYGVDNPPTLQADEFAAKYDAETKTFTYEVRIPFSYTNINPIKNPNICMGVQFTAAHQNMNGDANRFTIGGSGIANYPNPSTTPFQGRCLKLALRNNFTAKELLLAGETAALFSDLDMGDTPIVLKSGKYIDLNGHKLTVNRIRVTGGDIIDSKNGEGLLVIPQNGTDDQHLAELKATNRDLALYDSEEGGYRFFGYSTKHLTRTAENQAQFGFALDLPAAAYELLKEPENADITLSAKITSEALSEDITYDFSSQIVSKFAQMKQAEPEENWVIVLKISGVNTLEEGQTLTVAPTFQSSTGIKAAPTAQTFTKYPMKRAVA